MRIWQLVLIVLVPFTAVLLPGCQVKPASQGGPAPSDSQPTEQVLRLVTTTSVRDSGLLEELLPAFEKENNCRVDVIAVGTGAALKMGETGDADVLVVHAPEAEKAFMQAGHGVRREEFMYNFFVLLGPPDDPAGAQSIDPARALKAIAKTKAKFVSRGDNSGTHQRELSLWKEVGGKPEWDTYVESGQGMGATLTMAGEMRAYTLSDEATYLNFQKKIDLVPFGKDVPALRNTYSVITIDPAKHTKINTKFANKFAEFLLAAETQKVIGNYHIDGHLLFVPMRPKVDGGP